MDKISDVKRKIYEKKNIPTESQIIFFKKKEINSKRLHIKDDDTLDKCGINKENNEVILYEGILCMRYSESF